MSDIEWTDETWNVTTGCTEASRGCNNCYARVMSKRLRAMARADKHKGRDPGKKAAYGLSVLDDGRWSGVVQTVPEALEQPLRWKQPRRIFVNSMSDLFWGTERDLEDARRRGVADPQPVPFEFIDRVFAVMNATHIKPPRHERDVTLWHTYQVLTKRPERMAEYLRSRNPKNYRTGQHPLFKARDVFRGHGRALMNASGVMQWPLPNVWLGTSVEDQAAADRRIPHLLRCPAAVRFLSCEPLLGAVNLDIPMCGGCSNPPAELVSADDGSPWCQDCEQGADHYWFESGIHWVIVGGESGHDPRPCNVEWMRSILRQCQDTGISAFVKQLGPIVHWDGIQGGYGDGPSNVWPRGTCKLDGGGHWQVLLNDSKGGDPSEWPEDLRVREWPHVKTGTA